MYTGSCLCGGVQLTITGKISDIIHCHCSLCRKSTGSAFATNGFVNTADFTVTQGQELLHHFALKSGRQRHFCRVCASPIYSSNTADPTRIRIRLGILDSEIVEKPISHNFVTSKANWDSLDVNLPQYEAHEPGRK
ncbi:GFA family protein [Photobacterium sp. Hal280]|uniref:GFA family protein n=1 Tax=Photobacterium sp. Hal280 TaxID=3035163 RepID=UPI00301D2FC3